MSIINNVLGLFLGNKYERDLKEINPYIDKIHLEFEKLKNLSNDELRDRTDEIKKDFMNWLSTYPGKLPMSQKELDDYFKERNW